MHAGDAALRVAAVGLPQAALGDHEHRLVAGHGQCRAQPGQPAADHQHVGETMRHPLGMKRHQITRDAIEHATGLQNKEEPIPRGYPPRRTFHGSLPGPPLLRREAYFPPLAVPWV